MTANAITISNRLEAAGLNKKAADAIASEIVDFNNRPVTKPDIVARLEARMDKLENKLNIIIALNTATLITILTNIILTL